MSAVTKSTPTVGWMALALCLLLLRVPAFVQPAGGDQSLYVYSGQTLLEGGVPYKAAWDQKPPGIFVVYALLWRVWPHQSVVALGDLVAAGLVAWLLMVLGRRTFGTTAGGLSACVFLLFTHPSLTRLSGAFVRGQCETFIALFVTIAIVLVTSRERGRLALVTAGVALAFAVWLKYNALAYALPIVVTAAVMFPPVPDRRRLLIDGAWIAAGVGVVTGAALFYFWAHDALTDLRLATIDYNLQYSGETYPSVAQGLAYVATLPFARARVEMIWFLGGLGALLAITRRPLDRRIWIATSWLVAATASIAVNGARNLPQYFVQAGPALAFAAGVGAAGWRSRPAWPRYALVGVLALGLWRVGDETPSVAGLRLGGLPELVENLRFDVDAMRGRIDRSAYLARFSGGKMDAAATEEIARYVAATTGPADHLLVFGFSGGSICAWSERRSASRFFWSRPVMIEFAADHPGYGTAGLLTDLERDPPALVILQKVDWHLGEALPNSAEFFLAHATLRAWLDAGYTHDRESAMFDVWRRRG